MIVTTTAPPAAWLADIVARMVAELEAEGIAEPLAEPFTLSAIVADLFRLTETPTPDAVLELIGA